MIQQKRVLPESMVAPSKYCKYFFRGEQASGDADNLVIGGADLIKNSGYLDASLWSAPGYMSVGGASGNFCTLDNNTHDLTLSGYTLIITARILKTAAAFPASEQYIVSSYSPGTNAGGIILSCRADGSAKLYVNTSDNTTAGVTSSANTLTNGTVASERSLVFIFPRESGVSAEVAVDGILNSTASATAVAGKSLVGGRAMRVGATLAGGAIDGYKIAALAAYQVPVDMTKLERSRIHEWAWRNQAMPIPDWVFA